MNQAETLSFFLFFFPFKYVIDSHKNDLSQFSDFLTFLVMVEIVDSALRAVIDSFDIYNINLLIKKKK